jgi:opacity protein-like surface antigen
MRKKRAIFHVLAAATGAALVSGTAAAAQVAAPASQQTNDRHAFARYVNVRFQYAICYPKDLLVPQGESANSDGQKYLSKDGGAELIVYGTNNALNETFRERLSETEARLAGAAGKVTYKVQKANWFVVSGQNEQTIFYVKTLSSHGQFKSFELTYERSAAALYDPLVSRFVSCFNDLAP